ncbi:hypothetical protein PM082_012483 [Marasmius tenuissimus]|nr:hypothetical protein PM082_012483 [Marasmius tenuissimus]
MQFYQLFIVAALTTLLVTTPTGSGGDGAPGNCNTGSLQGCNTVTTAGDSASLQTLSAAQTTLMVAPSLLAVSPSPCKQLQEDVGLIRIVANRIFRSKAGGH